MTFDPNQPCTTVGGYPVEILRIMKTPSPSGVSIIAIVTTPMGHERMTYDLQGKYFLGRAGKPQSSRFDLVNIPAVESVKEREASNA